MMKPIALNMFMFTEDFLSSQDRLRATGGLTHLEANMFQAFLTMSSRGLSRAWLLLTSVADFSYLLKGTGAFHKLNALSGGSHDV